ncbi:MAG: hypothetical protein IJC87_02430 [Clostridia bacterium]|nr:hypothetical protein [Clostridia bacterium]
MKAKRTLALWLLSAMFVVCSFFGVLSLNNKEVRAETTTPTWQQTLIANSNDGMIAFPTPIDNWKTSTSVISFDSDQPSVTITLLYSNMENYSHRATEKNVFSGTLVEASPSNYYHYEINASAFDVKGGGEYTGEETVYGFSNRGSAEFKIANLQVTGLTVDENATPTPTWEQTVEVGSTVIAFESPVENWIESPAVLHFDSDQPSVTITLLLDINDWSSRVTTKGAFSGTLVEASPSNYYHYDLNIRDFTLEGAKGDGTETVVGFSNRGSASFQIANVEVTGIEHPTYETPTKVLSLGDLTVGGNSIGEEKILNGSDAKYDFDSSFLSANKSLVFKFKFTPKAPWSAEADGLQMNLLGEWANTGGIWVRPDKIYMLGGNNPNVASTLVADTTYEFEYGRLAIMEGNTFSGDYYYYLKIDGNLIVERTISAQELDDKYSVGVDVAKVWIQSKAATYHVMQDIDYVPQEPIVETYETPANAISVGDLKENGNLVGDELSLNNKNNAILSYDSNFKTANNSVIFKFKFVTNQWSVDGDGIQIGLMGKWAVEGGLWLRPDKVRIIKASGYVESITLAPNATYDIEYGRLAILENGVYTGSFYFYVKIDGELKATYETTQASMLTSNKATTDDLAQPNVWIQRKEGLANVMRDVDYVSFTYETPDVVDVSDLLYNGLPFGGAYTIATTRFTIGKELTATNHSLSFRFVFNPKTWDEDGSPQIHFIDSYSDTGFAWLKPNNAYILKADGKYTSSGSAISNALHLVEVGRLAKVSDADGSVMGYKFFVKIDGVTVVEYELASSEFASVSNLQDILNSKTIFITTDVGNQIYDVDYFPQMENAGDLYLVPWRLSASGIAFTASIESKIYNFRKITESGIIVVPTKNVTGNITLESTYENLLVIPASVSENAGLTLLKAGVLGILDGNICKDYTAVAYVKYAGADGGVIVAYSKPATTNLYEQISKAESVPAEVSAKLSKALAVNIDLATSAVAGASISGAIGDNTITLTGSSASYSCYMINGQEVLAGETIVLGYSTYTVAINANKITLTKVATETVFGVSEHYTVLNDHYPEYLTPENIALAMDELGLTSYRFDIALSDLFSVKEGDKLVLRVDAYQKINALLSQMEEQGKTDSLAVLWYIQPYGHDYSWDGANNYVGSEKVIDFRSDWYTRYLDLNEEAVRQVALLFPQVVNFEVWNEPELYDQMVGWDGSTLTRLTPTQKAQFLTDIMYRVNRALKSVNSDIILTSPSLCTFQQRYDEVDCTTDVFLRSIYEAIADNIAPTGCEQDTKADNYFDVVNIHPYVGVGNTTDSNWENWLETIHQISVENGDANTPIWITEFGFNTNGLTDSEINSKASILSSIISLIKNTDYITRVYFYTAIDDSTSEQKWGLFAWNNRLEIKATGNAVKEALK